MLLAKARGIKEKLLQYEGHRVEKDYPVIWKIMVCPKEDAVKELIDRCREEFNADELNAALNYRETFNVYIVYRHSDSFPYELYASFTDRNKILLSNY